MREGVIYIRLQTYVELASKHGAMRENKNVQNLSDSIPP